MYLSISNSFRVIWCLSQCVSPKIAIFTYFVFPGDAPEEITLNVVWMEREFDAYKLSRCMCPSNYNRFWDRARYWSKCRNCYFSYPLAFDAPVRGGFPSDYRYPVRHEKTRMAWLPDGEKLSKISLLVLTQLTNVTDRQTDTACRHIPPFAQHRAVKSIATVTKMNAAYARYIQMRHLVATTLFQATYTIGTHLQLRQSYAYRLLPLLHVCSTSVYRPATWFMLLRYVILFLTSR